MANNGRGSNEAGSSRSFSDFCEGYLLGVNENHANCQQNTGMDTEQGFQAPDAFATDFPGDLAGGLFYGNPDAFDGDVSYEQLEDALEDALEDDQAGNFLFEQPVNTQLPLTLVNPFYMDPADAQGGSGNPANGHGPMPADPFPPHYVAHPDPLVPAQSRFLPTTVNGFGGMRVEDLIFERPDPLNESCDLALSDAGDENVTHEQGNWDVEGQLAHLLAQPQPPQPSPEEHPIPCGREQCHICQVFSLPF